ncbi:MAG: hypothetical protein ACE5H3_00700 [Planctomycetota bacterium]
MSLAAPLLTLALSLLAAQTPGDPGKTLDPGLLAGMKARSIGPAAMSGRISALAGVDADPETLYVGAASGGLWRSEDGGLTWKPLFDEQPVASIGAVAVNQSNPDVVWVGTGEGNPRNSISVGNGVYKSIDRGATWKHVGLGKTESISRIILHPTLPDVAWVAALGTAWGENPQRGVFKTVDGGKTWKKVLFVNESTGAADLALDPRNPDKLLAALWDYRRWPWFFRSGGPGSGLYVSWDGGENWERRTADDGLPKGNLGRIGVAFAPSDPRIVYAFVEAKENRLYRSEDGGRTWHRTGTDRNAGNRPFYYAKIAVDPVNPNRIYSMWSQVSVSDDGGRTFKILVGWGSAHPDHHAFWIDPGDPLHLVDGNDGGVSISRDRGKTWKFVRNLPVGQFYHVRTDDQVPYHVYGGMQDNGSWKGPSEVWENGGIQNHHWQEVAFGDGFDTVSDPEDPMQGWAMSQEGHLVRWNLRTGERKNVRPAPREGEELRFNWNAGIAIDPFDPRTLYFGSQFLHRSRDRGESWEIISPDLTTNNPEWQKQAESGGLTPDVTGAENFTTILAIVPSPLQRGVLWVGTDDGRLHVTRNGGSSWTSVEKNVIGVPPDTWIPHIAPSPHHAGTAFVVFDNHRRADQTPYLFKTADYGRSWTRLASDGVRGYALSVVQDPEDAELLFLGTEFGLYFSLDGGRAWFPWKHGLPTASVMDLAIPPSHRDLVLGTHGRSIFILDDIAPLRSLSTEVLAEPLHLFPASPAVQHWIAQPASSRFPGQGEFRGENRPYGALLTYSLYGKDLPYPGKKGKAGRAPAKDRQKTEEKEAEGDGEKKEAKKPEVKIEITDPDGTVIRTLKGSAELGLNRIAWDLRRKGFRRPGADKPPSPFERGGPEVLPGTYGVTVTFGEQSAKGEVKVLADPRFHIPMEDRRAKFQAILEAGKLQETLTEAVKRIQSTRADVDAVLKRAEAEKDPEEDAGLKEFKKKAADLKKGLKELEKAFWTPPGTKGIPADKNALAKIQEARGAMSSSWERPTPSQKNYLSQARSRLEQALEGLNRFFEEKVAPFRSEVRKRKIEFLPVRDPIAID